MQCIASSLGYARASQISLRRSAGATLPLAAPATRRVAARRAPVAPRAGKEAAVEAAAEIVWEATGVPLVDELASFATIQAAGLQAGKLIALAMVGIFIGSRVISIIGSAGGKTEDEGKTGFHPLRALIAASSEPAAKLLPLYGAVYSATVTSALLQVIIGKAKKQFNELVFGNGDAILEMVKTVTQLIQDASEIILIVGAAWTIINLKDRVFAYITNTALAGKSQTGMGRILRNIGGLLNYGIYAAAFFATLATTGINLTPILASLGGASVIIGLAAQSVLGNVASSVTLYAAPPFAVGDAIKLLADGALVVEGTVLAIEPMRTILKTTEGSTLYIDNAKVISFMVQNDSQKQ